MVKHFKTLHYKEGQQHSLLPTQFVALTVLTIWLLASGVFAQDAALDPSYTTQTRPFELHKFTLPNGLRVWCQPRSDSKSVVVYTILQVGSRYETLELNGISHFLEHIVFTGTERWDENEIKEIISRRGGRWNGWTGEERTAYYAEVADQDIDIALDWMAELVFHASIPVDKIEKERTVIFQEKWGKYGWLINTLDALGFGYELWRKIEMAIFPDSTLTFRIIGEDESLERIEHAALLHHYQQYYMPNNAALIVVGNVRPDEVRQKVETYFGDVKSGTPPARPAPPAMPEDGPHTPIVRGPVPTDQCRVIIGARTVGLAHADVWPLKVLSELLHNSLTEEIRYKRGLVYGLWVGNTLYSDAGYFEIATRSERQHIDVIQEIIEAQLDDIRQGQIDAQKLADAKTALHGRWALSMESNSSRARWLEDWLLIYDNDEPIPDYQERIQAVTAEDLTQMVNRYFTPQRWYVAMHLPILTINRVIYLVAAGILLLVGLRIRRRWLRKKYQHLLQREPSPQKPGTR